MERETNVEKMRMESVDLISKNVEKIAELFPECVTEAADKDGVLRRLVDFEKLRQLLSGDVAEEPERYDFTWVGKRAALAEAHTPIRKTLRPCPEESRDWDTTQNLYIEGDNLDVLKLLQESYLGKVKMIYIDPPYNTGSDSFVYPDNYRADDEEYEAQGEMRDEEGNKTFKENNSANPRFHSDWCSMMYSRLSLARNILRNDGVIFISIDENEVFNLKKLCDEVFGCANYVASVVIENDSRVRPYDSLSITHEFLLIYRKTDLYKSNLLYNTNRKFQYHDKLGGFDLYELRNRNSDFNISNRPNLYYPFWVNPESADENGLYKLSLDPKDGWEEFYPQESQGIKTVWRWGKEKAKEGLNSILFGKKAVGGWQVVKKYRENTYSLNSVWTDNLFSSDRGTLEFKALFNNKRVFPFPKPVELVTRLIELACDDEALILDFFSGSSTTAQAVLQMNSDSLREKESSKNLRYIMVQYPELCDEKTEAAKAGYPNICEIGKERIRRAGDKIKAETPETTKDLDIGFRVLKVDSTNMNDVYYGASEIRQDLIKSAESNVKDDRTDLDLLFGCILDWGLPLSLPYKSEEIDGVTIHDYNDGDLIACFAEKVSETVVTTIAKRKPIRVVFRDSCFETDAAKINVTELFKRYAPDARVKTI